MKSRSSLIAGLLAVAAMLAAISLWTSDTKAQSSTTGTLVVMDATAPSNAAFAVQIHPSDNLGATVGTLQVPGSGQDQAVVASGAYTLSELEQQDYVVAGWSLANGTTCPADPQVTTMLFTLSVPADTETRVCVYNESATPEPDGTLWIAKVGAPSTQSFNIQVHDAADLSSVVGNVVVSGSGVSNTQVAPGNYTLSELEQQDYILAGWAEVPLGGQCPAEPDSIEGLFNVSVASGGNTVVCVYNQSTAPEPKGTLWIAKVGAPASQSFNIEIHDAADLSNVVGNLVVPGSGVSNTQLVAGDYTLSELEQQDYVLEGWAEVELGGQCPTDPDSTENLFTVSVASGDNTVVCVYNSDTTVTLDGFLRLHKVGGDAGTTYTFALDGPDDRSAVTVGAGSTTNMIGLDVGDYTITEQSDLNLVGWALGSSNACPAEPTNFGETFAFSIEASQTSDICAYNEGANQQDDPSIDIVSPDIGHTAGGKAVGIAGDNFTGATAVLFGQVAAVFEVRDDQTIVATTPPHNAGTVDITVVTSKGSSENTAADNFTYQVMQCPVPPLWVNDHAYGSAGGGFYWDPVSGLVWTAERGWHQFAPIPPRPSPQPLWVDALTYGSRGGGFYWDPVSGLVWTAERGWHAYNPVGCIPN